jgi:WhiB family redox-sensing transcriptional regulator
MTAQPPTASTQPARVDNLRVVGVTRLITPAQIKEQFPASGEHLRLVERTRREARAKQLCAQCPVIAPCKEFARENHEYGFWAGESEEDRHLAGFTVAAPIGIRARMPRSA